MLCSGVGRLLQRAEPRAVKDDHALLKSWPTASLFLARRRQDSGFCKQERRPGKQHPSGGGGGDGGSSPVGRAAAPFPFLARPPRAASAATTQWVGMGPPRHWIAAGGSWRHAHHADHGTARCRAGASRLRGGPRSVCGGRKGSRNLMQPETLQTTKECRLGSQSSDTVQIFVPHSTSLRTLLSKVIV